MVSKEEKFYRLQLIRSNKIGPSTYWYLLNLYKSAKNAVSVLPEIIEKLRLKNYKIYSKEQAEKEIYRLKQLGIRLVFFEDDLYPPRLREIPSPPPVLSFIGNKEKCIKYYNKKMLAIVGSRNASLNNLKLSFKLAKELSTSTCIVSGLARGIDTNAHRGSLENGTIAILAGGVNKIYPKENKKLYENILKNGGIFSEMPIDTYPSAHLFPRRNSIIAGISDAVLIVEAAQKSGSLITAKIAKSLNRMIFAIPNSPVDFRSQGCNELIKNGAKIVMNVKDILNELNIKNDTLKQDSLFSENIHIDYKFKANDTNEIKKIIMQLIDVYEIDLDDILKNVSAPYEKILHALIELELEGKIKKSFKNKLTYIPN